MENQIIGKYADQRLSVLKEHAPKMYEAMLTEGTLEAHLADMQERVSDYVDMCAEKYKMSDEYRNADPVKAMQLLNMTVLEAEEAAYREWIGNIPGAENKEENENE